MGERHPGRTNRVPRVPRFLKRHRGLTVDSGVAARHPVGVLLEDLTPPRHDRDVGLGHPTVGVPGVTKFVETTAWDARPKS